MWFVFIKQVAFFLSLDSFSLIWTIQLLLSNICLRNYFKKVYFSESFSFMGSIIVKQVVQLLLDNHNMREASAVLLAGSSAGGTGVFLNVDRVQGYLKSAGSAAIVRGVSDSAWYLKRDFMERVVSSFIEFLFFILNLINIW